MKLPVTVSSLVAVWLAAAGAAAQTPLRINRAEVLASDGSVAPRDVTLAPLQKAPGLVYRHTIHEPGASLVQLRFNVRTPGTNWAVRVLAQDGSLVSWQSSVDVEGSQFWSEDVPGSQATVEVYSTIPDNPLVLVVDGVAIARNPVTPASITIPDERAPIGNQSPQVRDWGRSVARLRFVGDDGKRYFCSGLLVSGQILMTNDHCISSPSETRSARVDFDYDVQSSSFTTLKLKEKLASDAALDYAVFRMARDTGRPPLRRKAMVPASNQPLLVIQHPGGEPKQVSIRGCTVRVSKVEGASAGKTDFGHLCDTLGGSSGSPVMDPTTGEVIGLHHFGFRDGVPNPFNQAVHIGLIVDHVRQARPDLSAELGP